MDLALESGAQVAFITTGGAIIVALIGVFVELMRRQSQTLNEVRENTAEARNQVANDHGTNLRDDLDRMHDDVREVLNGLRRQSREIREIREDLQMERRERLAVEDRLDDHLRKPHIVA